MKTTRACLLAALLCFSISAKAAAGFAQPGQPRTEADDEPLAKIERLEEDLFHPVESQSDGCRDADFWRRIRHANDIVL